MKRDEERLSSLCSTPTRFITVGGVEVTQIFTDNPQELNFRLSSRSTCRVFEICVRSSQETNLKSEYALSIAYVSRNGHNPPNFDTRHKRAATTLLTTDVHTPYSKKDAVYTTGLYGDRFSIALRSIFDAALPTDERLVVPAIRCHS